MKIQGIIPPHVTPFDKKSEEILPSVLRQLIDFLVEAGVHGIFSCGSYGEFAYLSNEERIEIWKIVVDEVNDRVPVIAGTGATTTKDAIALARQAEDLGADAAVVVTPYYLKPTERELFRYYQDIIESTNMPVLLYNVPEFTGITIQPDMVRRLAEFERVIGMKDSSGDMAKISETVRLLGKKIENFSLLAGSTPTVFPILELGGVGANIYIANIIPDVCVELFESYKAGKREEARDLQLKLLNIDKVLVQKWGAAAVKGSMRLRGIPAGYPRRPLLPLKPEALEEIKNKLVEHGLLG